MLLRVRLLHDAGNGNIFLGGLRGAGEQLLAADGRRCGDIRAHNIIKRCYVFGFLIARRSIAELRGKGGGFLKSGGEGGLFFVGKLKLGKRRDMLDVYLRAHDRFIAAALSAVCFRAERKLCKLLGIDKGGGLGHGTGGILQFRKGYDIAQGRSAAQQHGKAVKSEGEAAVRRCAVIKGIDEKAETTAYFRLGEAQGFKNGLLNIAAVDAHAAASQLRTVEHDIKGLGADKLGAGFDVLKILRIGHGKGVVHGDIALLCLGVFKHGKIGYK